MGPLVVAAVPAGVAALAEAPPSLDGVRQLRATNSPANTTSTATIGTATCTPRRGRGAAGVGGVGGVMCAPVRMSIHSSVGSPRATQKSRRLSRAVASIGCPALSDQEATA